MPNLNEHFWKYMEQGKTQWKKVFKNIKVFVKKHYTLPTLFESTVIISTIGVMLLFVLHAFENSLFFQGIPINWAFQHFNPLRRLFDGQIPGVDFIVFHWTGLTLLFAPIFAVLGQNLFSSEFSRYFLNALSIFLAIYFFLWVVQKKKNIYEKLLYSSTLSLLFWYSWVFWLLDPFGPAYSSLWVRTLIPIISFVTFYHQLQKIDFTSPKEFAQIWCIAGLLVAFSMFFSTEQWIAMALSFFCTFFFVSPAKGPWSSRLITIWTCCMWLIVSFLWVLFVYSLWHIEKPLTFLFHDIPIDQIWYYGAPPNRILTSIYDLYRSVVDYKVIRQLFLFILTLIFIIGVHIFQSKRFSRKDIFFIYLFFLYGLISITSNIWMYSPHYFEVSSRVCLFLIIFIISHFPLWEIFFKGLKGISLAVLILLLFTGGGHDIFSQFQNISQDFQNAKWPKYSWVYLSWDIWNNYFNIIEKHLWAAKTELYIDTSFSDSIWKNGKMNVSTFKVKSPDYLKLRSDDQVKFNNQKYLVLWVDYNNWEVTVWGNLEIGSATWVTVEPAMRAWVSVTTSPFFSTQRFQDPQLRWFVNGIKIGPEETVLLLETSLKPEAKIGWGDTIEFEWGQKGMVTYVSRNEIHVASKDLKLQPFEHGFPHPLKIYPWFESPFTIEIAPAWENIIQQKDFILNTQDVSSGSKNTRGFRIKNIEYLQSFSSGDILSNEKNQTCEIIYIDGGNITCKTSENFDGNTLFIEKKDFHIGKNDIWSVYSGILEYKYNVFNPSNFDYMIHVLWEKNREEYVKNFQKIAPKFVFTLRSDYTPYEKWLQVNTWPFYELLLRDYKIIDFTGYSIIWKKRLHSLDLQDSTWQEIQVWPWVKNVRIPVNSGSTDKNSLSETNYWAQSEWKFVVLEINYTIKNPYKSFPIIGSSPRFMLTPLDTETPLPISLPPYKTKWTVPVYTKNKDAFELNIDTITPIPFIKTEFVVSSIRYKFISPTPEEVQWLIYSNFFPEHPLFSNSWAIDTSIHK